MVENFVRWLEGNGEEGFLDCKNISRPLIKIEKKNSKIWLKLQKFYGQSDPLRKNYINRTLGHELFVSFFKVYNDNKIVKQLFKNFQPYNDKSEKQKKKIIDMLFYI